MTDARKPVACTLTTKDAAAQVVEWHDLRGRAHTIERVDGGAAMTLGIELADAVEDLAAREQACCAFLSISVTRADDDLRLEITSDHPDAGPVIDLLAGFDDG